LAEVESSGLQLILLTWLCGLRAHVANWVVLGSFTLQPLLWDSDLSSIRVKDLLTLTLGSCTHFLLESPDITDDRLLHQKTPKILLDVNRDPVPLLCSFGPPTNPRG
jgi:hypothetical protein